MKGTSYAICRGRVRQEGKGKGREKRGRARSRGVTGLGGLVKAMHCKELTTAILSLLPSLFPLALAVSEFSLFPLRRSHVATFSRSYRTFPPPSLSLFLTLTLPPFLSPHHLYRRPLPFLGLSLSYSSHRFFIVYYCLFSSPLSLYLSIYLSIYRLPFFPALLSLPFSTALSLVKGALGRDRY